VADEAGSGVELVDRGVHRPEHTVRHFGTPSATTAACLTRSTKALAHESPAAAMACSGRVELSNEQLHTWIGEDKSSVSNEKLAVLSDLVVCRHG